MELYRARVAAKIANSLNFPKNRQNFLKGHKILSTENVHIFDLAKLFFARSIKLLSCPLLLLLGAMWYHLNMVGPIEKFPMHANLY